jgi:F0F1-type ATP synthase alpha subunit
MDSKSKVLTGLLEQANFYLSHSKKLNYAATFAINRLTRDMRDAMNPKEVTTYEGELYEFIDSKYPQIFEDIRAKKQIDKENEEVLRKALDEFKVIFSSTAKK